MNGKVPNKRTPKKAMGVTISIGEWESILDSSPTPSILDSSLTPSTHDDIETLKLTEQLSDLNLLNPESPSSENHYKEKDYEPQEYDIDEYTKGDNSGHHNSGMEVPLSNKQNRKLPTSQKKKKGRGFNKGTQSSFCLDCENNTSPESPSNNNHPTEKPSQPSQASQASDLKGYDLLSSMTTTGYYSSPTSTPSPDRTLSLGGVLEVTNLNIHVKTQDIINHFENTCQRIKWIDEYSCLVFFRNSTEAKDAYYRFSHPVWGIKFYLKPTNQYGSPSPSTQVRPKTTAVVARRLITNALEIKDRDKSQKQLMEEAELKNLRQQHQHKRTNDSINTEVWLED